MDDGVAGGITGSDDLFDTHNRSVCAGVGGGVVYAAAELAPMTHALSAASRKSRFKTPPSVDRITPAKKPGHQTLQAATPRSP